MELKHNKELLHSLYVEQRKSLSEIAAIYSKSPMTIRAWLINNKIATRPSTQNIYKEIKATDFSQAQKSLIVGSLLGDGGLQKRSDCINARFSERHCEEQKDYLLWKLGMLKPFVTSKVYITEEKDHVISNVECKVSKSYSFSTITHPFITKMYDVFYKDGNKVVPNNLNTFIDLLVITIWICDDGCFTYDIKSGTYRLDLHTESFYYKENAFLCRDVLSKFFNVGFRINKRHYLSGEAFYICLSGKHKLKSIVKEMKEFIPDCMLYKFKHYLT